jgi:hypothetical protein
MVTVSVEIGYERRTVELSNSEWKSVLAGDTLIREVEGYYEGDLFAYIFQFNSRAGNSLVVTYDDADAFIGKIADAVVDAI